MADYSDIVKAYAEAIQGAEVAALNRLNGLMKQRVHNKGLKADDSPMGGYKSATWKKKRQAKGRQISYVDLEYEGDLRAGYGVGITEGKINCLGFFGDPMADRANKMQNLFGAVFAPTDTEIEQISEQYDLVFDEQVRNALRS